MNIKNYKPILLLTISICIAYTFHKGVFYCLQINCDAFRYSVEFLYGTFFLFSVLIAMILLVVKVRSFDNVGMSFLLATSSKLIVCYLILRPLLQNSTSASTIEKTNFFITFVVFLAIETLFTIRLVNKNQ